MRSYAKPLNLNNRFIRNDKLMASFQSGEWSAVMPVAEEELNLYPPSVELSYYFFWVSQLSRQDAEIYKMAEFRWIRDTLEEILQPKSIFSVGDQKSLPGKKMKQPIDYLHSRAKLLTHFPLLPLFSDDDDKNLFALRILNKDDRSTLKIFIAIFEASISTIKPDPQREAQLIKTANILFLTDLAIQAAKANHFVKDKKENEPGCFEILDQLLQQVEDGSAVDKEGKKIPIVTYLRTHIEDPIMAKVRDNQLDISILEQLRTKLLLISNATAEKTEPFPIIAAAKDTLALTFVTETKEPHEEKVVIVDPRNHPEFKNSQFFSWFDQLSTRDKAEYEYSELELLVNRLYEIETRNDKLKKMQKAEFTAEVSYRIAPFYHSTRAAVRAKMRNRTLERTEKERKEIAREKLKHIEIERKEIAQETANILQDIKQKFIKFRIFQSHNDLEKLVSQRVDDVIDNISSLVAPLKNIKKTIGASSSYLFRMARQLRMADEIIKAAAQGRNDECKNLLNTFYAFTHPVTAECLEFYIAYHTAYLTTPTRRRIEHNIFPLLTAEEMKKVVPFRWLPHPLQVSTDPNEILQPFQKLLEGVVTPLLTQGGSEEKAQDLTVMLANQDTRLALTNPAEAQRKLDEAAIYINSDLDIYVPEYSSGRVFNKLTLEERLDAAYQLLKESILHSMTTKFPLKFMKALARFKMSLPITRGKRYDKGFQLFLATLAKPNISEDELKLIANTPQTAGEVNNKFFSDKLDALERLDKQTQDLFVDAMKARLGIVEGTKDIANSDHLVFLSEQATERKALTTQSEAEHLLALTVSPGDAKSETGLTDAVVKKLLPPDLQLPPTFSTSPLLKILSKSPMAGLLEGNGGVLLLTDPKIEFESFEFQSFGHSRINDGAKELQKGFVIDCSQVVDQNLNDLILEHCKTLSIADEQQWHDALTEEEINRLSKAIVERLSLRGTLAEWHQLLEQCQTEGQYVFTANGQFPKIVKKSLELILETSMIPLICEPGSLMQLIEKANKHMGRDPKSKVLFSTQNLMHLISESEPRFRELELEAHTNSDPKSEFKSSPFVFPSFLTADDTKAPQESTLFAIDCGAVVNQNLNDLIQEHCSTSSIVEDTLSEADVNKLSETLIERLSLRGKLTEWQQLFEQLRTNGQHFVFIANGQFPKIMKKCLELILKTPTIHLVCEPVSELILLEKANQLIGRNPQSKNNVLIHQSPEVLLQTQSRLAGYPRILRGINFSKIFYEKPAVKRLKTTSGDYALAKTGCIDARHPDFLKSSLLQSNHYAVIDHFPITTPSAVSAGDAKSVGDVKSIKQVEQEGTLFCIDCDDTIWDGNIDNLVLKKYFGIDNKKLINEDKFLPLWMEDRAQKWHNALSDEQVDEIAKAIKRQLSPLRKDLANWQQLFKQLDANGQPYIFVSIGRFPKIVKKLVELYLEIPEVRLVCEPLESDEIEQNGKAKLIATANELIGRNKNSSNNALVDNDIDTLRQTRPSLLHTQTQQTSAGYAFSYIGCFDANRLDFLVAARHFSNVHAHKGKPLVASHSAGIGLGLFAFQQQPEQFISSPTHAPA